MTIHSRKFPDVKDRGSFSWLWHGPEQAEHGFDSTMWPYTDTDGLNSQNRCTNLPHLSEEKHSNSLKHCVTVCMWTTTTEGDEYIIIASQQLIFLLKINFCFHYSLCRKKKKKCCAIQLFSHLLISLHNFLGFFRLQYIFFSPGFSLILQNNILIAHVKLPDS